MLCPLRKTDEGLAEEPNENELNTLRNDPLKLATIRLRQSDIAWWMRLLCQHIATWANLEDQELGKGVIFGGASMNNWASEWLFVGCLRSLRDRGFRWDAWFPVVSPRSTDRLITVIPPGYRLDAFRCFMQIKETGTGAGGHHLTACTCPCFCLSRWSSCHRILRPWNSLPLV